MSGSSEATAAPVRLSDLVGRLDRAGLLVGRPSADPEIADIHDDSRKIGPGDLFCAWAGTQIDAHDFVGGAETAGASAALVERPVEDSGLPQVIVGDGRRAAAVSAAVVFGDPAARMKMIGVTGTNGKTTTVWLLRHMLDGRYRTASIGTLGVIVEDDDVPGAGETLTTPGPVEVSRTLKTLADADVQAVAMEASSHALDQGRIEGIRFDVAVFTNLSRDHLDYHGTFEAYLTAKKRLIDLLRPTGTLVINADDRAWESLADHAGRTIRFGIESEDVDLHAADVDCGASGARFRLVTPQADVPVELPLPGSYNVQNALAAAAACIALGYEVEAVAEELARLPQVPGRLERIAQSPCAVLRDYAHTPEALERALGALGPITAGRVIVVFGAGGDRDRGKRPLMGAAAERGADIVIVTSDNPRSEDPNAIIDEITSGMEDDTYERVPDRREAIRRALELAAADDAVLLAGKGHETYQVIGERRVDFDERDVVQQELARMKPEDA